MAIAALNEIGTTGTKALTRDNPVHPPLMCRNDGVSQEIGAVMTKRTAAMQRNFSDLEHAAKKVITGRDRFLARSTR